MAAAGNNFETQKDVLSTKQDIRGLRTEIVNEIANLKTDMIKWVFAFFVTLALMVVGLYLKK